MESKITTNKCNSYPTLMQSTVDNIVVLFINETKGVIVFSKVDFYKIGDIHETWNMEAFKEFRGTIELKN